MLHVQWADNAPPGGIGASPDDAPCEVDVDDRAKGGRAVESLPKTQGTSANTIIIITEEEEEDNCQLDAICPPPLKNHASGVLERWAGVSSAGIALESVENPFTQLLFDADNTVWLWELRRGVLHKEIKLIRNTSVNNLAFSPDGKTLAIGFGHGGLSIWNTETQSVHDLPLQAGDRADSAIFSPCGNVLISTSYSAVTLWSKGCEPRCLRLTDTSGSRIAIAISPNSKRIALSHDGCITLYDLDV